MKLVINSDYIILVTWNENSLQKLPEKFIEEKVAKEVSEHDRKKYLPVLSSLFIIGEVLENLKEDGTIMMFKILMFDLEDEILVFKVGYGNAVVTHESIITIYLSWKNIKKIVSSLFNEVKKEAAGDFTITKEGRVER